MSETIALIGLALVVIIFLVKLANLMSQSKLYSKQTIFLTMIVGLIGWALLFVSLNNEIRISDLEQNQTIITPNGNVTIPNPNYDYYSIVSYLAIANPLIWICGLLTLLELIYALYGRTDRAGQEKTRKDSFY